MWPIVVYSEVNLLTFSDVGLSTNDGSFKFWLSNHGFPIMATLSIMGNRSATVANRQCILTGQGN